MKRAASFNRTKRKERKQNIGAKALRRAAAAMLCAAAILSLGGCSLPGGGSFSSGSPGAEGEEVSGADENSAEKESADVILEDSSSAENKKQPPFDPETDSYISEGTVPSDAGTDGTRKNTNTSLSVPTILKKIGEDWFLVDCYHSQILYLSGDEETMESSELTDWNVLPAEGMKQPHTIAGDGTVLLADDTENNRVLVYCKDENGIWQCSQVFTDIGTRPHFSVYDSTADTFYVWSSENGELYCFRRAEGDTKVYLTEVRSCERLKNTYVRSFTVMGSSILFVAGTSGSGDTPAVILCNLGDLAVRAEYPVASQYAGMVQIMPVLESSDETAYANGSDTQEDFPWGSSEGYFATISTDAEGSQDYATILRISSLEALTDPAGQSVQDIYSTYFVGGGTPYYMSRIDGAYFLTEHRLPGHSLWKFMVEDGAVTDEKSIF
jgi:hypothetical protein